MSIFDEVSCAQVQQEVYNLNPLRMRICAGWIDVRIDITRGNSGGPLVCINSKNEKILVGIASYSAAPFGDVASPLIVFVYNHPQFNAKNEK